MRRAVTAALLGLILGPAPAGACALELVLAMDVSGSINSREHALQSGGLAQAFENERLIQVVTSLEGGLLVTLTQWSGGSRQERVLPWHHLSTADEMSDFAEAVRAAPREWRNFSTAIGEALIHAEAVSQTAPMPCARRVIDVSGDGVSNEGRPPAPVARRLAAAGYVINGLVIRGADPDPVAHYEGEVIAGSGAFVEVAETFEDYPRAILRKLLREIDRPLFLSRGP